MKRIPLVFSLLSLAFITCGDSTAAQSDGLFAIQLEASRHPVVARYQQLEKYGTIYSETSPSGLIRVKIGPYPSESKARGILKSIRKEGFHDAFLSTGNSDSRVKTLVTLPGNTPRPPAITSPKWRELTPEEKSRVVYLDGVLHIKEGDRFIPLSDYTP